jgi:hypothetical protein
MSPGGFAPEAASGTSLFELEVVRPDDLLVLRFAFTNLHPDPNDAGRLTRVDPAHDALVVVTFPPQHVQEQLFEEHRAEDYQPEPLTAPPVISVAARASRLAFRLPAETSSLPITLDALLDWSGWQPVLAANALPETPTAAQLEARPRPAEPAAAETAIELPYRLMLSPLEAASWAHAVSPQARDGRVELWHTRLATRNAAGETIESESTEHPV